MHTKTTVMALKAKLAATNSIRGALFVLKNNVEQFGNCHVAYEFTLRANAQIRGDQISVTTLPREMGERYIESGGAYSDPIIEKISELEQPLFIDMKDLVATTKLRFHKNPFYRALLEMGCVSLAAYPLKLRGSDNFAIFTVFQTLAQKKRALSPAIFIEVGLDFHTCIKNHGQLGRQFQIDEKEKFVLEEMARGMITDDIAEKLGVTRRTVEGRLQSARKKLKARTTTEAVYKAKSYSIIFQDIDLQDS